MDGDFLGFADFLRFVWGSIGEQRCVAIEHLRQGQGWGIAVLEALENRSPEGVVALLRHLRDLLAIAFDDKIGQSALEIGIAGPGDRISLEDCKIRCRGERLVEHKGVFVVLRPEFGDSLVRQP